QDSLSTFGTNKAIEGADFSFTTPTARTTVTNNTQIFTKTWEVSGTQEEIKKAGVVSEVARRMENALKELATDVEQYIINGTGNSGASGTAREMKGLLA